LEELYLRFRPLTVAKCRSNNNRNYQAAIGNVFFANPYTLFKEKAMKMNTNRLFQEFYSKGINLAKVSKQEFKLF